MPQTFLSPGVETVEVDQSFIQAAAPVPGAILIGRTMKGPAFRPVTVKDFNEFSSVFGGVDPTLALPYAAKTYLKNSNSLTVVRVLGHDDGTSASSGYSVTSIVGITDTSGTIGTTGSILAVLHTNQAIAAVQISGVALDANRFTVRIGTTFATTASFLTSSDDYVGKVLNTDPTKYSTYGHYLYQTFPFKKQATSASWYPAPIVNSNNVDFLRDYVGGLTTWIKSQPLGGVEYDLLRFWTVADGRATNDAIKVQIDNIKPSSAPNTNPFGTFDVVVRSFYDTDSRPVELERFAGLNLDINSPNFVLRRIGDILESFNTATRKFVVTQGTWPNKSRYIVAELNTLANYPQQALPWGFRGYTRAQYSGSHLGNGGAAGIANIPDLPYTPNQIDANGNFNDLISWGVSFVSGGVESRMRAAPDNTLTLPLTGSDADFSMKFVSGTYVNGVLRYGYNTAAPTYLLYTSPVYASGALHSFTLPFYGGFDGWDLRVADPLYLNNGDGTTVIGVVAQKRAIDCVANPDQVVGDTLALPGQHNIQVADAARAMVNKRKDMFYVMDLTGSTRQEVVANLNGREIDDNYTAGYYPDLIYTDTVSNRQVRVPPSVGVMGALAYTDRVAQAFFAPAGLNRGGLSQFGITDTIDRLNHDDRDALYEARINPITKFPVEGIVIFGQKTMQLRPSALDRVNVRRLLILAKRAVAGVAMNLAFEPNNPATWTRFVNKVNPILDGYRRDQGINRFKVVMDQTTNTSDVIDRNEMKGKIFLEPTRAAEFITIDFIITPSGVEFGS
jgi:hypothetical protein